MALSSSSRAPSSSQTKIRSLVVNHASSVWGAQLNLCDLARPLRERGIELVLAAPRDDPLTLRWLDEQLPYVPLVLPSHTGLRKAKDTMERPSPVELVRETGVVAASIARIVKAGRGFDALHSFNLQAHLEVAAAGRLLRVPTVLDLVNIVQPGLGRKMLAMAARLATVTVANSRASASTITGGARVAVVHPGIDLDRFSPGPADPRVREELGAVPGEALVGIVGRVDPRKGVQVLVEAMALLPEPFAGTRLAVVGDTGTGPPDFIREVQQRASELLGDRVRFVGRRGDIPEVMRALDVMVNASRHEPFGLTVLEAMACGTPVIGTEAGGVPEFVTHDVSGLLVPPFEARPLADAIARLVDDTALCDRIGAAGKQVASRHGLELQYDEMESVYERFVGRPG